MTNSKPQMLILAINDDLFRSLELLFRKEGFEIEKISESGQGVTYVLRHQPSVILMSEDMPPVGNSELLPVLRRLTRVPIIVVGEGGEIAVVNALLQGADLYMTWPLNYRELLSRMRALLRRANSERNARLSQASHTGKGRLSQSANAYLILTSIFRSWSPRFEVIG